MLNYLWDLLTHLILLNSYIYVTYVNYTHITLQIHSILWEQRKTLPMVVRMTSPLERYFFQKKGSHSILWSFFGFKEDNENHFISAGEKVRQGIPIKSSTWVLQILIQRRLPQHKLTCFIFDVKCVYCCRLLKEKSKANKWCSSDSEWVINLFLERGMIIGKSRKRDMSFDVWYLVSGVFMHCCE